jgi:hypothetical protein
MTTWRDFLVEHAKFPFPRLDKVRPDAHGTTDISLVEAGLLAPEWKAQYAVRDENLFQKLCQTLGDILGDTHLPIGREGRLLESFGRHLQFTTFGQQELEKEQWSLNDCEAQVRVPGSHSRPSSSR